MKKFLTLFLVVISTFANQLAGANITGFLTYASFNIPSQQPYFETYISVIGNTVRFIKNANGKYQGAVDISISFAQKGAFVKGEKFTLNSPEINDTTAEHPNFIDVHRFSLPSGDYEMELSIADKNKSTGKPFISHVPVKIDFPEDRISISDVELLESYTKATNPGILTKSGFDLVPYVSTFFPENIEKLRFYAEIYNTKKFLGEGKMLISYYVESFDTHEKISDFGAFSKQDANDVNIILSEFNLKNLPSGNYNLVIEVRDKENKIQAERRCFLQRKAALASYSLEDLKSIDVAKTFVSGYTNVDTLMEYLRCLRPISGPSEIRFTENQLKARDLKLMQQFFYNFWNARDPKSPELAWFAYYQEVRKVNKEFGSFGLRGYDTDRGRVYLQYGPPDSRTGSAVEPSAYPYEIWQYNSLVDKAQFLSNPYNKQSNKRFVFYNPDLVTNNYTLLHSDAKGERYNARWQVDLHKRDSQYPNLDQETVPDHYGNKVDENYRDPK